MPTKNPAFQFALRTEARFRVGDSAWRFINSGLRDIDGRRQKASVKVLELLWTQHCLGKLYDFTMLPAPTASRTKAAWEGAMREAQQQLLNAAKDGARYLSFNEMPVPVLGLPLGDGIEEAVAEAFSAENVLPPLLTEPSEELRIGSPLEYAHAMAKYNRARTEQRIVLLFHFAEALRQPHQSELPFEAAEAEFQAVSGHLWSQRSFYRAQSHDLAILLGGEALEEAAADIRRGWGPGMSVMQLHAREGYLPSRWLSADEEALPEWRQESPVLQGGDELAS